MHRTTSGRTHQRTSKALAANPRLAKISFTGETVTGRLIMQYAAQNIIPSTVELGGKSPKHLLLRRHGP
jgi:acyl-CoA reductase-like NAD-dependent aldehyde dehydrogenase